MAKASKPTVKAKLVASPSNSKKKVYDVCIVWPGGDQISCGVVMASSEAEAKKLGKALAKKATSDL